MTRLDRTEQRIAGVLIEKQLSVPDSYPLSENALVDGCNQKNNRDPVTELVEFQVAGALMAMQQKGVIARVDGGGRVARFRHKLDEVFQLSVAELAVIAELLLRGPQAPGALKPRVARMGYHASPEQIEALLRAFAQRSPALAEQLPLGPRERDRRWRHLIGDGSEATESAAEPRAHAAPVSYASPAGPVAAAAKPPSADVDLVGLVDRVRALEQHVASLQADVAGLLARRPPE